MRKGGQEHLIVVCLQPTAGRVGSRGRWGQDMQDLKCHAEGIKPSKYRETWLKGSRNNKIR